MPPFDYSSLGIDDELKAMGSLNPLSTGEPSKPVGPGEFDYSSLGIDDELRAMGSLPPSVSVDALEALRLTAKDDSVQAAQAPAIANQIKVPSDLVRQNFEQSSNLAEMKEAQDLLEKSPITAKFLSDVDNARIVTPRNVHDLSGWEQNVRAYGVGKSIHALGSAGTKLRETRSPAAQKEVDKVRAEMRALGAPDEGFLSAASEVGGQVIGSLTEDEDLLSKIFAGASAGAVVGAASSLVAIPFLPVTATAGAIAGATSVFVGHNIRTSFEIEGGLSYLDLIKGGVSHDVAAPISIGVGAINSVLELLGQTVILAPFAKATKLAVRTGVRKALSTKPVTEALKSTGKYYAAAIAGETVTEVLQEAVSVAGEAIGKGDAAVFFNKKTLVRLGQVAEKTIKATMILGIPGAGVNFVTEMSKANHATNQKQGREKLHAQLMKSELQSRASGVTAKFHSDMLKSQGVNQVEIDAKKFNTFYQEELENDPKLGEKLGIDIKELDSQVRLGGTIKLSPEGYSNLFGLNNYMNIDDHVRLNFDDMTAAEAKLVPEDVSKAIKKAAGEIDVETLTKDPEAETIVEDVKKQLLNAGQPVDLASSGSVIVAETYKRRAELKGEITALELYKLENVVFKRDENKKGRASIDFPEDGLGAGPIIITFSKTSDKTSFVHEVGHLFREQMKHDAKDSVQLAEELNTVDSWMATRSKQIKKEALDIATKAGDTAELSRIKGLSDDEVKNLISTGEDESIMTAVHEQWARGVENYFKTGKAPNVKLQETFNKFRVWITAIYSRMKGANFVQFSSEVTGVMDRLIASEEDITLAKEQYELRPFFRTAEEAGMTKNQFKKYLDGYVLAQESAVIRQNKKYNGDVQRERTDWWKEESKKVRKNIIEPQVHGLPEYKTLYAMALSEQPNGDHLSLSFGKLNWNDTKKLMGWNDDDLGRLPTVKGQEIVAGPPFGSHPNVLAATHGYGSGKEMLEAMIAAPVMEEEINNRTNDHMKKLHGDMELSETRIEEAGKSVHDDVQGEILVKEINALSKLNKVTANQLKKMARERISLREIKNINPSEFLNAERRNGKEAAQKLKKGDKVGAVEAKLRQALNFYMAMESQGSRSEVEKKRKYLEKFEKKRTNFKEIDVDYVDKIKQIVGAYGLGARLSKKKRFFLTMEAYNEWIREGKENDGSTLQPHPIVAKADGKTHYKDLTLDEFRALHDHVKNIETQGKLVKRGVRAEEILYVDDLEAEIVNELVELPELPRQVRKGLREPGNVWIRAKDRVAGGLASFNASLRKVEFMLERIDGKKLGPAWQGFFKPFADAENLKSDLNNEITTKILEAKKNIPSEIQDKFEERIFVPGLDQSFTRSELIIMALNIGTESNFTKMVEGSAKSHLPGTKSFTREGVLEAMDNLSKEEWVFVQTVWDSFEHLRPVVEEIYKHEHGVAPVKVEGRKFITKDGQEMEGRYYPMYYDRERSFHGQKIDDKSAIEAMKIEMNQASVFSGMTKQRTEFSAPVSLELNALSHHVDKVTHFISYYDAVRLTRKLLKRRDLSETMANRVGPEAYKSLERWIGDLASNGRSSESNEFITKHILGPMRANATIAILGASLSTIAIQPLGLLNSFTALSQVGKKLKVGQGAALMGSATMEYLAGRSKVTQEILQDSSEMGRRLKGVDQDLKLAFKKLEGKKGVWREFQRFSLMGINMMQYYVVDIPTWIAAKNKAISEGMAYTDAVDAADSTVRMSQGSGGMKDLSEFQRNQYFAPFTMFYSYFNVLWNILAQSTDAVKSIKDAPQFAAKMFLLLVIPTLLESIMRQKEPPEDENYAAWLATQSSGYALSSIPLLRSFVGASEGFGFNLTPLDNVGTSMHKAYTDMAKALDDGKLDGKDALSLFEAGGYLAGIPGVSQIKRMVKASDELIAGKDIGIRDFVFGPKRESK